jgi:hypothetical protein
MVIAPELGTNVANGEEQPEGTPEEALELGDPAYVSSDTYLTQWERQHK